MAKIVTCNAGGTPAPVPAWSWQFVS